jgi:hypothetical protein
MKSAFKTEREMRAEKAPSPETREKLAEYIDSLVEREHDYGTCVYAMSLAATAAFNYVALKLGVTGFQASCADLDVLRRTRNMEGPFILFKAEDALYPQYDLPERLRTAMYEWRDWLAEQARLKLSESRPVKAHPNVLAHWRKLAGGGE